MKNLVYLVVIHKTINHKGWKGYAKVTREKGFNKIQLNIKDFHIYDNFRTMIISLADKPMVDNDDKMPGNNN